LACGIRAAQSDATTTAKEDPAMHDARRLDEFRDRLANARLRLARSVARTDADLEALAARDCREIAEDRATGTVGDLLARLEGQGRHELDEIDAAQARLAAGRYGACEDCHTAIPLARLRAMPATRRCATCETYSEAKR
jgi:RNA polymerase-binding transcription factor DksA